MNRPTPKFRDKRTSKFVAGERVKDFQGIEAQIWKRLKILNAADGPQELVTLPGNRFEALRGVRQGQFSIRVNDRWRICFDWPEWSGEALNIEIIDYH